jgi:SAM-dependent methyltransferase
VHPSDLWSRVDYRRLIAWPERIEREWPFLAQILADSPSRAVLDLGSGTGEHSRFLADHGFDVVGLDSSPAMLDAATDRPVPNNLRFLNADIADVGAIELPAAGAAVCLGNTLPHLGDGDLRRLAQGLAAKLLPGAPLVIQVLNYERLRAKNIRHLPLNFRAADDGGEVIFLRLVDVKSDGTVTFTPTTLHYRPNQDPPVEVVQSRTLRLHAWTWVEISDVFSAAGFERSQLFGGFDGSPFNPAESSDLIAVIRR